MVQLILCSHSHSHEDDILSSLERYARKEGNHSMLYDEFSINMSLRTSLQLKMTL